MHVIPFKCNQNPGLPASIFIIMVKVLLGAGVVMVDAVELVVVVVVDFLNLHRNVNSRRQVW